MKEEQPFSLAVLEEIVILLSFVGWGTLIWLAEGEGVDWWRGAVPQVASAYAIRFIVEAWLTYRKKPLLRLVYENR